MARLNDDRFINSACVTSGTSTDPVTNSFRERYLAPTVGSSGASFVITAADRHASCSLKPNVDFNDEKIKFEDATTCSCPTAGTNPTLAVESADAPRFAVRFNPHRIPSPSNPSVLIPGDPLTVEVVAYGCTNRGAQCDPGSTETPDGTAVVRALLKVRPKFPNAPGAGLVAGAAATTGGNLRVINLDLASNGITINSGTAVDLGGGTSAITLPGTPPRASVLDSDPSLNALTNADANGDLYFQSFFGETMDQYKKNPQTWLLTKDDCAGNERCTRCTSATACGGAMKTLLSQGLTQFWSEMPIAMGTSDVPNPPGTIGSPTRPITFAGTKEIEFTGNLTAYGMFFVAANDALSTWEYEGSGTAQIFGSFVSRGNFKRGSGSVDLIYSPNIFRNGETTGLLVRVSGSWRDKETPY
jgi:hypothetical protein